MENDDLSFDTITFHCRSPIHMCPDCSSAESCKDLLQLLKFFRVEEKPPPFDYRANFPRIRDSEPSAPDPRNSLNELSAAEWVAFTRSVFTERYPHVLGHEIRRKFAEYKSPNLMGYLISFFTKSGENVIDPFAGVGSSLIAAALMDREAIGYDTDIDRVDAYYQICKNENIPTRKMAHGDCSLFLSRMPASTFDFAVIDPPGPFSHDAPETPRSKGRSPLEDYFNYLTGVFKLCHKVLKFKKHMAVFTKNVYMDGKYMLLTPHYAVAARAAGFVLKGEKIWENPGEKTHPRGYPRSYVPNVVHHTILILQKPAPGAQAKE